MLRRPLESRLSSAHSNDPESLLLCGYCQFDAVENDVLLRALPRFVLLQHDELERWPWLTRTLEHLSAEYMSEAPGSDHTVDKLTEVLLVQLLRADFGRKSDVGIVAALRDQRVARALTAIHQHPGQHWTIENAAAEASMSRSGFSRKFKELLGTSFFDYLTRLRMRAARELLVTTDLRVPMIGEKGRLSVRTVVRQSVQETAGSHAARLSAQTIRCESGKPCLTAARHSW